MKTGTSLERHIGIDSGGPIRAAGRGFATVMVESLGRCAKENRGEEVWLRGAAGVADAKYVCLKNASDAYAWSESAGSSPIQAATIATGAVTAAGPWVRLLRVDTEAAAASDDLDTIAGGSAGQVVTIHAANDARTVNVTGAGNIDVSATDGTAVLNNAGDTITLIHNGTKWLETGRSNNGA